MTTITDNLNAYDLSHPGKIFELPDGRKIRIIIEQDDAAQINDYDCYGQIEWIERYPGKRPDNFDGNAEKMWTQHESYWWQPPEYVKRSDPGFDAFRSLVKDLMDFGFYGVAVEVLQGTDAYGRPIVVDVASLWGIDSLENGCLEDVVNDLLIELNIPNELDAA